MGMEILAKKKWEWNTLKTKPREALLNKQYQKF